MRISLVYCATPTYDAMTVTTSVTTIVPGANLTNANLSGADARGANFQYATLTGANTSNLIQSNGHIAGLDLTAGASLVVRDYDGNPAAVRRRPAADRRGPTPGDGRHRHAAAGVRRRSLGFDDLLRAGHSRGARRHAGVDLRARRRRRHPKRPHDRPVRLDRRDAHRRVHRFQPLHLEPLQSLHHRRSDAHRRAELPGDFNGNGTVGPEDYNVWKANFGSTTLLAADGNGDGIVDAADYTVWRNNLGATLPGGGSAGASPSHTAAPEPSSFAARRRGPSRLDYPCSATTWPS